jgi:hypothetical protein
MYKNLDLWLPSYWRRARFVKPNGTIDLMMAVCDHFEPLHDADKKTALEKIAYWKKEFSPLIKSFPDADRILPRHTFFYPIEQYDKDIVSSLAELCQLCGGEVEIHLHHERDTAEGLREKLERGKNDFQSHGLLSNDEAGNCRYGFIHGNWALDNSHPQGRGCGVSNELGILKRTGCYADFTLPSAPSPTQTKIINSIYYATDTPEAKSHDAGILAKVKMSRNESAPGDLLLVQGPLGLNWERRKFKIFPKIENGEITGANPPRPDRMKLWLNLGMHVQSQPNWLFIKLHTHGGIPQNMKTLLGDSMRHFYEHLLENYNDGKNFRLHFVTAREMVNIIHAAEDGHSGNAGAFRNYRYKR